MYSRSVNVFCVILPKTDEERWMITSNENMTKYITLYKAHNLMLKVSQLNTCHLNKKEMLKKVPFLQSKASVHKKWFVSSMQRTVSFILSPQQWNVTHWSIEGAQVNREQATRRSALLLYPWIKGRKHGVMWSFWSGGVEGWDGFFFTVHTVYSAHNSVICWIMPLFLEFFDLCLLQGQL